MIGMPRRVLSAWVWNSFTMSTHAAGMLFAGVEPPPDSTEPSLSVAIMLGLPATAPRSAWVIWPIFSSSVIRPSRSWTRSATGWAASRYTGRVGAALTADWPADCVWLAETAPAGTNDTSRTPTEINDLRERDPMLSSESEVTEHPPATPVGTDRPHPAPWILSLQLDHVK